MSDKAMTATESYAATTAIVLRAMEAHAKAVDRHYLGQLDNLGGYGRELRAELASVRRKLEAAAVLAVLGWLAAICALLAGVVW